MKLNDIVKPISSQLKLSEVNSIGKYIVYGASGKCGYIDTFKVDKNYVALVKDGAGVGHVYKLKATDSFLGTMQGLVPNDNIDRDYVYYLIRYLDLGAKFNGATIPHIYFKNYGSETIKNIDYQKQVLISKELSKIEDEIFNKKKQFLFLDELVKSRFIEMFGDRLINLNKKMSSIATPIIGLTYKPSNVTKDGTIVLRSGNIQNNELQLEEDIVRVSNINISEQKWIKDKDILMCSRNGSARLVGKSCLIRHPKEHMSFGAFMTVVRTKYPYFLQGFFTSDYFKNQLTGVGTASVNQITSGMLNNYDVIEPTEVEEKEFESYVKQIDKSKFIVQQEIKDLQELLDKKMDEYFGQ